MIISTMDQTTIESVEVTDVGNVRSLNEDSIAIVSADESVRGEKGTVMVLADGLGGCSAGEVASTLVTTKLPELYYEGQGKDYVSDLTQAVSACNTLVHKASLVCSALQGMGTTLVAAVIVNQYVIFVNVGDSRGYLFRDGSVIHRTKDHSLKDASFDNPVLGSRNRFSHVLTRAIGPKPTILIDVTTQEIAKGDTILLCSDGLTDCVSDDEIKKVISAYQCAEAGQMLVNLAKEKGGEDNISVVLATVTEIAPSNVEKRVG